MDKIIKILKEHFSDVMTEDVEKKLKESLELIINEKVNVKKSELEVSLKEEKEKEIEDYKVELAEKLSEYTEIANKELIDENLKNIESFSKVELAEKLVNGMLTTIKENNINIAIEDKDIISQLEEENTKVEKSLNETVEKLNEATKQNFENEKAISVLKLTEKMTATEREKVINMVEGVSVKDINEFNEKVENAVKLITEKDDKTNTDNNDDLLEEFDEKVENPEIDVYKPVWHHKYQK